MRGTVADPSPAEERTALALCNLVPCDEEEVEERMDRFRKKGMWAVQQEVVPRKTNHRKLLMPRLLAKMRWRQMKRVGTREEM